MVCIFNFKAPWMKSVTFVDQRGMILVTTLLFLFAFTLLILAASQAHILEVKMGSFYLDKTIALNAAEIGLLQAQAEIEGQPFSSPRTGAKMNYRIHLQDIDKCQRKTYLIAVNVDYQGAKIKLEALYQKRPLVFSSGCLPDPNDGHRLWWREIL